jgi:hypothetical protein
VTLTRNGKGRGPSLAAGRGPHGTCGARRPGSRRLSPESP